RALYQQRKRKREQNKLQREAPEVTDVEESRAPAQQQIRKRHKTAEEKELEAALAAGLKLGTKEDKDIAQAIAASLERKAQRSRSPSPPMRRKNPTVPNPYRVHPNSAIEDARRKAWKE